MKKLRYPRKRKRYYILMIQRVYKPVLIGILTGIITAFIAVHVISPTSEETIENHVPMVEVEGIKASPSPSPTPYCASGAFYGPCQEEIQPSVQSWTGYVSHYSRKGCIGCSETLTMANGEPLDDNRLTIAFNKAPLNSKVRLTNLDNGKSVIATITDTGGFERHGRIADLVPAVAEALRTKTDQSQVRIELL